MKIGAELKNLRKHRRLTLADVSNVTKLSVSFLSDAERGRIKPSLDTLEKLADFYQVSINDIVKETEFSMSLIEREYPPGFKEFLNQIEGGIDEEAQDLLLRVENRAKRRAETKEDWMQIYYSLKTILGR